MGEFDKQDFREFVKAEMKKWDVPGAAVLLIKDGKVIFSEGFGYRDIGKRLPVNSKTIFIRFQGFYGCRSWKKGNHPETGRIMLI